MMCSDVVVVPKTKKISTRTQPVIKPCLPSVLSLCVAPTCTKHLLSGCPIDYSRKEIRIRAMTPLIRNTRSRNPSRQNRNNLDSNRTRDQSQAMGSSHEHNTGERAKGAEATDDTTPSTTTFASQSFQHSYPPSRHAEDSTTNNKDSHNPFSRSKSSDPLVQRALGHNDASLLQSPSRSHEYDIESTLDGSALAGSTDVSVYGSDGEITDHAFTRAIAPRSTSSSREADDNASVVGIAPRSERGGHNDKTLEHNWYLEEHHGR